MEGCGVSAACVPLGRALAAQLRPHQSRRGKLARLLRGGCDSLQLQHEAIAEAREAASPCGGRLKSCRGLHTLIQQRTAETKQETCRQNGGNLAAGYSTVFGGACSR